MRGAWILVALVALAGCAVDPEPEPLHCDVSWSGPAHSHVTCAEGLAVRAVAYPNSTSHTCPQAWDYRATCAQGCALVVDELRWADNYTQPPDENLTPEALCAETPAARPGDTCKQSDRPCAPTRVELASDGTVRSQAYLTCDATFVCVVGQAPVVPDYLAPCDDQTLRYATPGAHGVVADPLARERACLIAWDAATGAAISGVTTVCVGDWDCPEGALCDDSIQPLSPTDAIGVAVCKPGPRGVLTPAMLHR